MGHSPQTSYVIAQLARGLNEDDVNKNPEYGRKRHSQKVDIVYTVG